MHWDHYVQVFFGLLMAFLLGALMGPTLQTNIPPFISLRSDLDAERSARRELVERVDQLERVVFDAGSEGDGYADPPVGAGAP